MSAPPVFKDYFSGCATSYARYRPSYPVVLYDYLRALAPDGDLAWDAGAGNGQVAVELARSFDRVVATDASRQQCENAVQGPNIEYRVELAEQSSLAPASVSLVTVAQALHWFDCPLFFEEVRRVLKPGGVLAVWSYVLFRSEPEVDLVVRNLYDDVLGGCWPPERRMVEDGYRDLPFPFVEETPPDFSMEALWGFNELMGYLSTWSAVHRYRELHGVDPLAGAKDRLSAVWGSPHGYKTIKWPIRLRVGRLIA
ncbi:MAG: class I SAM-dependent methyltransferase [Burkholderiales bacterium]